MFLLSVLSSPIRIISRWPKAPGSLSLSLSLHCLSLSLSLSLSLHSVSPLLSLSLSTCAINLMGPLPAIPGYFRGGGDGWACTLLLPTPSASALGASGPSPHRLCLSCRVQTGTQSSNLLPMSMTWYTEILKRQEDKVCKLTIAIQFNSIKLNLMNLYSSINKIVSKRFTEPKAWAFLLPLLFTNIM